MPLKPILMTPAYRHGSMTPWGGDQLQPLYNKAVPGEHTGESLELSAIPGLESRDEIGRTLTELIENFGEKLIGTKVGSPFPLLLKLIDAREQLSVQVHPDDAYAKEHHGKLGKNEAWVILHAAPGAELIMGLKDGVTKEQLWEKSLEGRAVEGLLNKVKVQSGDVFYIPAGTVHAIGGGLVLYEIQQSSDLTYRLYDWGRVDAQGKGRDLHLEHSINVTTPASHPQSVMADLLQKDGSGTVERMLDTPFFQLDRLSHCHGLKLQPDLDRFSVITALEPMSLHFDGEKMQVAAGQTVMLPADGYALTLEGASALMARPAI